MSAVSKPLMVMPPIYRFHIPGRKRESEWGWHRATELLEAANNILVLQGREAMDPRTLCERFPFIDPHEKRPDRFVESYLSIWQGRQLMIGVSGRYEWLSAAVRDDSFLPAKVGMELIRAVKQPVMSSIRRVITT